MKAVVVSYLSQHPFFLISLVGVCIGVGASCVFRRRQHRRRPVVFRRRCRFVTPLVLTAAVAVTGGAFLTVAGPLLLREWRSAVILAAGFTGWTFLVISTPRWWRLFPLAALIAVLGIPLALWNPIPDREFAPLRRLRPLIVSQEEAQPPEGLSLALLRVRQVPGSDSLELAMLSTTPLLTMHTEPVGTEDAPLQRPGIWPVVATVPLDASVRITVETVKTPAVLWWFPPSGLPLTVTVDAEGQVGPINQGTHAELRRYPPGSLRASLFTGVSTRELTYVERAVIRFPREDGGFLQPGLYLIGLTPDGLIVPGEFADSQ
jgi:hypothetical protein